jgi:predicted GNAT family N-acyltransferase
MTCGDAFTVRLARWQEAAPALRAIRHAVFVVEQHVPESLEWDDADATSLHALAVDPHAGAIGCARLLPDGHIGRVAVLARWRGRGVGTALLLRLIDAARMRGHAHVLLNAQVDAMPFYARYGFVARGDVFDEAGIPHRVMERAL